MNCNDGFLLLLYDMNVSRREEVRKYNRFRKAIIRRGYEMIQYSFYKKYLQDLKSAEYEVNAIRKISPENSCIHIIKMTTKQAINSIIPISKAEKVVLEQDLEDYVEY